MNSHRTDYGSCQDQEVLPSQLISTLKQSAHARDSVPKGCKQLLLLMTAQTRRNAGT